MRWAETQAGLLRRRAAGDLVNEAALDWTHLAEEIDSLGRSERREMRSRLEVLLCHLLKWRHQSDQRSSVWRGTIMEQRRQLDAVLDDSPSLRPLAAQSLARSFRNARDQAERETGLLNLPSECAWTIEEVLSLDSWPE